MPLSSPAQPRSATSRFVVVCFFGRCCRLFPCGTQGRCRRARADTFAAPSEIIYINACRCLLPVCERASHRRHEKNILPSAGRRPCRSPPKTARRSAQGYRGPGARAKSTGFARLGSDHAPSQLRPCVARRPGTPTAAARGLREAVAPISPPPAPRLSPLPPQARRARPPACRRPAPSADQPPAEAGARVVGPLHAHRARRRRPSAGKGEGASLPKPGPSPAPLAPPSAPPGARLRSLRAK